MIRIFKKLYSLDTVFCVRIHGMNGRPVPDRIFHLATRAGDGYWYAPFLLTLMVIFPGSTHRLFFVSTSAFLLNVLGYKLIKRRIRRIRPFESVPVISSLIKPPDAFSFPSGHTSGAVVLTVICTHYFPVLLVPGIIYSVLVGFSRVYNGVHYPGDILAGAVLGFVTSSSAFLVHQSLLF